MCLALKFNLAVGQYCKVLTDNAITLIGKLMPKLLRHVIPALFSVALACSAASSHAGEILIDFETLPGIDGVLGTADDTPAGNYQLQPLSNQYEQIGVIFNQGTLMQASFFNGNPLNHFISSTNPIGYFTTAVTGISIDSYSYWDATLTAYGRDGNVLTSNTLTNPLAGSAFLRGVLSVTSSELIFGFSILPNNPNYILNLDNLRLTTAEVPEPSQIALLGAGLALIAGLRRRRRA